VLLTGEHISARGGRVPVDNHVVSDQRYFSLYEWPVRGFTVRHQQGVIRHLVNLRPRVVVTMCHSGTTTEWAVIALKKLLRFRLVAWQCGYEYNPGWLKRVVLRWFVPRFDHHLAYHTNAGIYARSHGAKAEQITVMHNTIDEAAVSACAKREALQILSQRFPSIAGKRIVLYVGAVLAEKRLELIGDALDRLGDDRVALVVVGDGPHLTALKDLWTARKDTYFAGRVVEGVGTYFDAADVFVLPGTGGLAINEAMAHGLPVISGYADGSADDLVIDNVNGFRFRSGDPGELAKQIAAIMNDGEMCERMGSASLQMIKGRFSFENFVTRVHGVLDNV
jgi:glycosyltransferase involved in cell wall biosynthesis